ncbi:MAG: U32 family peptidase [Candidatus Diapherotrites archaeon]
MSGLLAPYNGDIGLVDFATKYKVYEFYGQTKNDVLGGGRSSFNFPSVQKDSLKKAVREMHDNDLKFNYTVNSMSFANKEFDREVQKRIFCHFNFLKNLEVDSITIANPMLMLFVKDNFPDFKICASVVLDITSLEEARFYKSLGVDRIILSKNLNKNYKRIREISENLNVEIQLVVNDPCLHQCPIRNYHNLTTSFSSMGIVNSSEYLSFCTLMCRKRMLENPEEIAKASWIRPEDMQIYRNAGVNSFKLVDRKESTYWIKRAIKAYSGESYDGNLADLCSYFSPVKGNGEKENNHLILMQDSDAKFSSFEQNKNNLRFKPFIDNKKLGKYSKAMIFAECEQKSCSDCGLCREAAENTISIESTQKEKVLHNILLISKNLGSTEFWGH